MTVDYRLGTSFSNLGGGSLFAKIAVNPAGQSAESPPKRVFIARRFANFANF